MGSIVVPLKPQTKKLISLLLLLLLTTTTTFALYDAITSKTTEITPTSNQLTKIVRRLKSTKKESKWKENKGKTSKDKGSKAKKNFMTQKQILTEFFESTTGEKWNRNAGWMEKGIPICKWHGIECNKNGKIDKIDMESNNLEGTIPKSLGKMRKLRILDLGRNNMLTGAIPKELGELIHLRQLYLDGTKLTGNVPREVCGLMSGKLYVIYIDTNKVSCECGCEDYVGGEEDYVFKRRNNHGISGVA